MNAPSSPPDPAPARKLGFWCLWALGVGAVVWWAGRNPGGPMAFVAAKLADDLQQFRMKTVPLTDDVVEWRERPHDALV